MMEQPIDKGSKIHPVDKQSVNNVNAGSMASVPKMSQSKMEPLKSNLHSKLNYSKGEKHVLIPRVKQDNSGSRYTTSETLKNQGKETSNISKLNLPYNNDGNAEPFKGTRDVAIHLLLEGRSSSVGAEDKPDHDECDTNETDVVPSHTDDVLASQMNITNFKDAEEKNDIQPFANQVSNPSGNVSGTQQSLTENVSECLKKQGHEDKHKLGSELRKLPNVSRKECHDKGTRRTARTDTKIQKSASNIINREKNTVEVPKGRKLTKSVESAKTHTCTSKRKISTIVRSQVQIHKGSEASSLPKSDRKNAVHVDAPCKSEYNNRKLCTVRNKEETVSEPTKKKPKTTKEYKAEELPVKKQTNSRVTTALYETKYIKGRKSSTNTENKEQIPKTNKKVITRVNPDREWDWKPKSMPDLKPIEKRKVEIRKGNGFKFETKKHDVGTQTSSLAAVPKISPTSTAEMSELQSGSKPSEKNSLRVLKPRDYGEEDVARYTTSETPNFIDLGEETSNPENRDLQKTDSFKPLDTGEGRPEQYKTLGEQMTRKATTALVIDDNSTSNTKGKVESETERKMEATKSNGNKENNLDAQTNTETAIMSDTFTQHTSKISSKSMGKERNVAERKSEKASVNLEKKKKISCRPERKLAIFNSMVGEKYGKKVHNDTKFENKKMGIHTGKKAAAKTVNKRNITSKIKESVGTMAGNKMKKYKVNGTNTEINNDEETRTKWKTMIISEEKKNSTHDSRKTNDARQNYDSITYPTKKGKTSFERSMNEPLRNDTLTESQQRENNSSTRLHCRRKRKVTTGNKKQETTKNGLLIAHKDEKSAGNVGEESYASGNGYKQAVDCRGKETTRTERKMKEKSKSGTNLGHSTSSFKTRKILLDSVDEGDGIIWRMESTCIFKSLKAGIKISVVYGEMNFMGERVAVMHICKYFASVCTLSVQNMMLIKTSSGMWTCDITTLISVLCSDLIIMVNQETSVSNQLHYYKVPVVMQKKLDKRKPKDLTTHIAGRSHTSCHDSVKPKDVYKKEVVLEQLKFLFEFRTIRGPFKVSVFTIPWTNFDDVVSLLMHNPQFRQRMRCEWLRYTTLGLIPFEVSFALGPLSRQGLYYDMDAKKIVCYSCGGGRSVEELQTCEGSFRRFHTLHCRHLAGIEDRNIPIGDCHDQFQAPFPLRPVIQASAGQVHPVNHVPSVSIGSTVPDNGNFARSATLQQTHTPRGTRGKSTAMLTRDTGFAQDLSPEEIRRLREENMNLRRNMTCKKCHENKVELLFLPCSHLVCCYPCGLKVKDEERKCITCDTLIESVISVFL